MVEKVNTIIYIGAFLCNFVSVCKNALATMTGMAVGFGNDSREPWLPFGDMPTGGELKNKLHSVGSLFKHPEIKNTVRAGQVSVGEFFLSSLWSSWWK